MTLEVFYSLSRYSIPYLNHIVDLCQATSILQSHDRWSALQYDNLPGLVSPLFQICKVTEQKAETRREFLKHKADLLYLAKDLMNLNLPYYYLQIPHRHQDA